MPRFDLQLSWGRVSYLRWSAVEPLDVPVVLLHGGGIDNANLSWGEVGPRLADAGYRVFAPDHPGYGESPPSPWISTQGRLVDYVGEFVDALGLQRYAIGGLSLGGGLTIGHVLDRPERVEAALLLGSYGLMDRQYPKLIAGPAQLLTWLMVRSGAMGGLMRACARSPRLMATALRTIVRNPAARTEKLLDDVLAAAGGAGLDAFGQWQRAEVRWNRFATNYTSRLGSFTTPTLLVHGERDTGVPLVRVREVAEIIPNVRLLVVPDAGHWVQRDRPDVVVPAMERFLADHGRPPATEVRP